MALVEIFHVVAAERTVATAAAIKEGMVVSLNSSGQVIQQSVTNPVPYGLAGDTKSSTASAMPGIASGWQNRVSDYFDETKASAKMTVYHSGGEFATDMFAANVASAAVATTLYAIDGYLDTVTTQTSVPVALLLKVPSTYPAGAAMSGVPGVDINGDQALGSAERPTAPVYAEIKLLI